MKSGENGETSDPQLPCLLKKTGKKKTHHRLRIMAPAFQKRSRALLLGSFVYKMQRQGRIRRGVQPPLAVGYARYCNRDAPQLVVGRRQKQKEMYMIEMPAGGHLWGRRSRIFVKSCRQQTGQEI